MTISFYAEATTKNQWGGIEPPFPRKFIALPDELTGEYPRLGMPLACPLWYRVAQYGPSRFSHHQLRPGPYRPIGLVPAEVVQRYLKL